MSANDAKCAQCGKRGAKQRCSKCKVGDYCSKECQLAGWKSHKKTCEPPPLPSHRGAADGTRPGAGAAGRERIGLAEVWEKIGAASEANDWCGVLKWEGRMEELLGNVPDDTSYDYILGAFLAAHVDGLSSTGSKDHVLSVIGLEERRVKVLGKMERFRDQGGSLNSIAEHKLALGERAHAKKYFNKARDLGAAHGFFSAESRACLVEAIIATLSFQPSTLHPPPSPLNPNPRPQTLNPNHKS